MSVAIESIKHIPEDLEVQVLGFPLSRSSSKKHDGTISVEFLGKDRGTIFTIRLPKRKKTITLIYSHTIT